MRPAIDACTSARHLSGVACCVCVWILSVIGSARRTNCAGRDIGRSAELMWPRFDGGEHHLSILRVHQWCYGGGGRVAPKSPHRTTLYRAYKVHMFSYMCVLRDSEMRASRRINTYRIERDQSIAQECPRLMVKQRRANVLMLVSPRRSSILVIGRAIYKTT